MLCLGKGGMMSEKAKMDKPSKPSINRYGFLGLWILVQALGWLFVIVLNEARLLAWSNDVWLRGIEFGFLVGIPTALLQKLVLRAYFGRWFRGWARANILGWLLGGLAISLISAHVYSSASVIFQFLALMVFPAIGQAWVLRQYISRTWLLLLSTGAATTVLTTILNQLDWGAVSIFPAVGMFAVVTGLTLLWLFGMQATENKPKKALDTSRLEDIAEVEEEAAETEEQMEQAQ
jgi:hypothetical protein